MKHSPGPWKDDPPFGPYNIDVMDANDKRVAQVWAGHVGHPDYEEGLANLRLILKAPEPTMTVYTCERCGEKSPSIPSPYSEQQREWDRHECPSVEPKEVQIIVSGGMVTAVLNWPEGLAGAVHDWDVARRGGALRIPIEELIEDE